MAAEHTGRNPRRPYPDAQINALPAMPSSVDRVNNADMGSRLLTDHAASAAALATAAANIGHSGCDCTDREKAKHITTSSSCI